MVLAVTFAIFGSRFIEVDDGVCSGVACHGRELDLEGIRRVDRWMLDRVVERVLVGLVRMWPTVVKGLEGIWGERRLHGRWEGGVASGRDDGPIKGYVVRQKTSTWKLPLPLPVKPGCSTPLASSQSIAKITRASRRRRREEETDGKKDSQLVGGSVRQGGHNLLFRKVSRLSLSQRAASLFLKNGRDDEGINVVSCPQIRALVFQGSRGGCRLRDSWSFADFFGFSQEQPEMYDTNSLLVRVWRGWGRGERNF